MSSPPAPHTLRNAKLVRLLGRRRGRSAATALLALAIVGALVAHGLLARIGGDEFVVLLDGSGEESALKAARALRDAFDEPFPLDGLTIPVQASIGIGLAPFHASTRAEILRCADVAMYRAKARGTIIESYVAESDVHSRDYLTL